MGLFKAYAASLVVGLVAAQGQTPQPPGTPWPNSTYPGFRDPSTGEELLWEQTSAPFYPSPWGEGAGDWAAAYAKARTFVSGLTLTEKVNLTTGVGWEGEKCVGNNGAIPRLGFNSLCLEDSPLGVRDTDFVSAFPAGVSIASTWDRFLIRQRGVDMGSEHRDKGVDIQLGPVVGPIGRAPEGGRNWEGFSPDPVLAGISVFETVQGQQSAGIMACTKHFILNEQEHFRQPSTLPDGTNIEAYSSNIDDVTMHELYLWPFADAIRAGTASVMCSYNQINNSYACQNSQTLNKLLKAELGFQGFVMSDWSAQHSGVSSALAGLDMTMPGDEAFDSGTSFWGSNLTIAVLNGTVPAWRLDDMCVRIMAAWYYVGRDLPQNQVPDAPNFSAWTELTYGYQHDYAMEGYGVVNYHVDVRANHAEHIRNASARGTVLLKNTGALPLSGKEKLTGVFGEDAGPNLNGPNGCSDRGCDNGTLAMGWGSGTDNFPYLVTPGTAIQNEVLMNNGSIESIYDNYDNSQIALLAQRTGEVNGACIVFGNSDSGEGYITVDGNEGDRNNLTLWHGADALVQNVSALCNNTILILHTVGPVLLESYANNPNITAIVWAGLPGQESGNSLVDVLYGKINPSGKLPFTMGATRESWGTDVVYEANNGDGTPQLDFADGIFVDYKAFDRHNETPVYEFGFGLSYTTFSYSDISVQVNTSAPGYSATTGQTPSAPTYGTISNSTSDYLFPAGFHQVPYYIYPFLNASTLAGASMDPEYGIPYDFPEGSSSSAPQPRLPASGPSGGNPGLYDILYTVSATVTNTGSIAGEEVPQLYVGLGGPNDPIVQLRQFDKFMIQPGQSMTFTAQLTRRDVSNWDPVSQNWVISCYPKTVHVGSSSRKLPLQAPLPANGKCQNPGKGTFGNSGSSSGSSSSASASASSSFAGYNSTTFKTSVSTPVGSGSMSMASSSVVAPVSGYGSSSKASGSASSSMMSSMMSSSMMSSPTMMSSSMMSSSGMMSSPSMMSSSSMMSSPSMTSSMPASSTSAMTMTSQTYAYTTTVLGTVYVTTTCDTTKPPGAWTTW